MNTTDRANEIFEEACRVAEPNTLENKDAFTAGFLASRCASLEEELDAARAYAFGLQQELEQLIEMLGGRA